MKPASGRPLRTRSLWDSLQFLHAMVDVIAEDERDTNRAVARLTLVLSAAFGTTHRVLQSFRNPYQTTLRVLVPKSPKQGAKQPRFTSIVFL